MTANKQLESLKRVWRSCRDLGVQYRGGRQSLWTRSPTFEDIGLRQDDADGIYNNSLVKDLEFRGRVILHVEGVWNDARTRGTRFDGEIFERLAIYETATKKYVAEQLRYNPRVLFTGPPVSSGDALPFMSKARQFDSFEEATAWIRSGPLIPGGNLTLLFEDELSRHASGEPCPRCPHTVQT